MSLETLKLRSEFFKDALAQGWYNSTLVSNYWRASISQARLERWFARLYDPPKTLPPVGGRLVNHFSLGADPEILFLGGGRYDANNLGMKAGPAFGADNNGRLVEFRPAASRSALEVLASLWLTMRWMVVYYPDCKGLVWRSGGYCESDGLGGHIHFGRKRATLRDREVASLDKLAHWFYTAGIFDRDEGRLRVRQAQGGHYGALSDIRKQPHGWEYRTLPSWMDTPWLAYFCLTMGKLAVALPEMVPPLVDGDRALTSEQARGQIRLFLAACAPLDDDARLAFTILTKHGFPAHNQGIDIKGEWGIFVAGPLGKTEFGNPPQVMPETVPCRPEDSAELARALYEGRAPELTPLHPTWSPTTIPANYRMLIDDVGTRLLPGLGEFAMGLCYHRSLPVRLTHMGLGGTALGLPEGCRGLQGLSEVIKPLKWGAMHSRGSQIITIVCNKDIPLEKLLAGRDFIVRSGALPLWWATAVGPESLAEWQKREVQSESETLLFKRSSLEPKF